MGQLKGTIDGIDLIKSSRFYRPLFLRSLPKSWLPSNPNLGVRASFEMKRPRVELPPPAPPAAPAPEFQFLKAPPVGLDQQNTPSPSQPPSLETGDSHNPIILEESNCTAATTTTHQPIRRDQENVSITDQKRTHATRYQRSQTVSIQNQVEYCVKDENSQKPNCAMEDEEDNFAEIDNMTIENMF